MSEVAARYRRRAEGFERTLLGVREDQWSAPSPCSEWSVRDVVAHVVAMHAVVVAAAGVELPGTPAVEDDPLGAFRTARAEVEHVLAVPALAAIESTTPAGTMTVEEEIDHVASEDLPQHRWDVARATGQHDAIDAEDLALLWAKARSTPPAVMEKYRTPGAFGPGIVVYGPEVPVPEDAPLQDRLLGHLGRDPGWRPPPGGGTAR